MKRILILIAVLLSACPAFPANGIDLKIEDVSIPVTTEVTGATLYLNGAGTRHKVFLKMNVVALYATRKFKSLNEFVTTPGPKRVYIQLLRDVPSDMLGKTLAHGIDDNTPRSELSKITPDLIRFAGIFNRFKVFARGDVVLIDWMPGKGMVISVNGQVQGEPYLELKFFNALVAIWLGSNPVDTKLKDALLGTM